MVVLYAAAFAACAPATIVDAMLDQWSAGRVRLASADGLAWRGHGRLELHDGPSRVLVRKDISWSFPMASLLEGRPATLIRIEGGPPVLVRFTRDSLVIADAELDLPPSSVALALPQLAAARMSGALTAAIGRLECSRMQCRGEASIKWLHAGADVSPIAPLGDYEARASFDGRAGQATVGTLEGALAVAGAAAWQPDAPATFRGTMKVAPAYRVQAEPLLRGIGRERTDGSFSVELSL